MTDSAYGAQVRAPRPRPTIEALPPYRPPLEGRRGLLRLDFNERTVAPHPATLEALAAIAGEDLAAYPEYGSYTEQLARYLGVDPVNVLPTNATDEAIQTVMLTYAEPGEGVLLCEPTFAMFRVYAGIAGAKVHAVRYPEDLSFPLEAYREAMRATDALKVAVIVDPNNPTTTDVGLDAIEAVCRERPDVTVFVDEAYGAFTGRTAIPLIARYPNLVVSQTFSKAHGLAGLRIGHLVACQEAIAALSKVRSPYSVNVAAMAAASAIMALPREEEPGHFVAEVHTNRPRLVQALTDRGLHVKRASANFCLVEVGESVGALVGALRQGGVLVRNRSNDPGLDGCFRVSVGTAAQIDAFLEVLDAALGRGGTP
ncbi:MAG: pyridoxal phosphate-dependent aminotransferase [Planctomycetota bacterium]